MRFVPDYNLHILPEEEFPSAIETIEEKLNACRQEGHFSARDGKTLYYEYFLAENSRASIVIVHGLSEFTKKYHELTVYFLNQGYNVFLYDQRSHGFSCRLTERIDLIHVDSFDDYVSDLEVFIDTVVLPAEHKPLYLYSHSMGGAVIALYLAKHSEKIQKAVMSAPLFDPQIGSVAPWLARCGVCAGTCLIGSKKKFKFSKEFNPNHAYKNAADASQNRFLHNLNLRREEPHYQSTPMTYGWVNNALKLRGKLLKRRITQAIQTPILLLSAEKDTVVKNEAQHQFAQKCPACQLVTLPNATHAMLSGTQSTLTEHVTRVLDFYRS